MNLGERIYTLRTERNLSQGDLADALDVSRQSISKWENNNSVPDLDKLVKMSTLFGVSLDELVLGKKREQTEPPETLAAGPEPRGKGSGFPPRKIVGTILLCVGLIVFLTLSSFGGVISGLLFSAPIFLCGVICFVFRRNAGLWCAWVVAFLVDMCIRELTGASAAFWGIGAWIHGVEIPAVAMKTMLISITGSFIVMVLITIGTVIRLRGKQVGLSKRAVCYTVAGWIILVAWMILASLGFRLIDLGIDKSTLLKFGWLYTGMIRVNDWCWVAFLNVVLTHTIRFIRTWRQQSANT